MQKLFIVYIENQMYTYDINEIKMVTINFHKLYKIITLYWFCNHKIKFEKKPKFTNTFLKIKYVSSDLHRKNRSVEFVPLCICNWIFSKINLSRNKSLHAFNM